MNERDIEHYSLMINKDPLLLKEQLNPLRDSLSTELLILLMRSYIKTGQTREAFEYMKLKYSKGCPKLINMLTLSAEILKEWHYLSQLDPVLMTKGSTLAMRYFKALYNQGFYKEIIEFYNQSDKFFPEGQLKAFVVFSAVKLKDRLALEDELYNYLELDVLNSVAYHGLTLQELLFFILIDPTDWSRLEVARFYFKKRNFYDCIMLIRDTVYGATASSKVTDEFALIYMEACCSTLNKVTLINELSNCANHLAKTGVRYPAQLYRAHIGFLKEGLTTEVANRFRVAAQKPTVELSSDGGAKTVMSVKDIDSVVAKQLKYDAEITWYSKNPSLSNMVTLVACDENYFLKFVDDFTTSFFKNNQSTLHIHIIGRPEVFVDKVKKLAEGYLTKINFTFELPTLENSFRPYYASARFLVAARLLRTYKRALLITDIDVYVNGSVDTLWPKLKKSDIGFKNRQSSLQFPWRLVPANMVYFGNSEASALFLDTFVSCFWYLCAAYKDKKIWWVDQSLLYSVMLFVLQKSPDLSIKNLYDIDNIRDFFLFHNAFEDKSSFFDRIKKDI